MAPPEVIAAKPRSAAAFDAAIDPVVVKIGKPSPSLRRNAIRQHPDDTIERDTIQRAIGTGAAGQCKQLLLRPGLRRRRGDDLLGQNVERRRGDFDASNVPV